MQKQESILPTGSDAPNTDEKLLSETNALVCVAGAKTKTRNRYIKIHLKGHIYMQIEMKLSHSITN